VQFSATVTAYDAFDNVKTNYAGSNPSLTTNLSNPPNGATPSSSLGSFSAGQATATVTAKAAESARKLTITDTAGTVATGDDTSKDSNLFTVDPAGPHRSTLSPYATLFRSVQFSATVTAYDAFDNVKTNYAG